MRTQSLAATLLLVPALALAGSNEPFGSQALDASIFLKETFSQAETAPMVKPVEAKYAADPRCAPETDGEPKLYSGEFRWDYNLPDMNAKFQEVYDSGKRLPTRAFWNPKTSRLEIPYMADRGGNIVITERLIEALARHIEQAFEGDLIDAVFFPDMGHSHLLVPEEVWAAEYSGVPNSEISPMYSRMFSDPRIHLFYHTAEQLKTREKDGTFVPGERYKHRWKTRNIAGPITADAELWILQAPDSPANTAHEKNAPGFKWYGAGFNFSASRNGCFSYTKGGKVFRFDISMDDLIPDPAAGGGAGDF